MELSLEFGRVISAGDVNSEAYFSRFLRLDQVWGSEIAGDTDVSVEICRDAWWLSAHFALANCISVKVPQGRVRLISDAPLWWRGPTPYRSRSIWLSSSIARRNSRS